MCHTRKNAAEQVKEKIIHMAHGIFQVVSEDPQIKHIAQDMGEASVHEHGAD
jgi:hypothetical protein